MGKAQFGIKLENSDQPVVAGSNMKGKIWAEVDQEISGSKFNLTFSGKEKCEVVYYTNSGSNRQRRTAHATRSLINLEIPLEGVSIIQNEKIQPGKYEIPFDIEIPAVLPSSFHTNASDGECSIRYKLETVLKGSGMFFDYECNRQIVLLAKPIDPQITPYEGSPTVAHVSACCCVNRGSMTFAARLSNSIIARNSDQDMVLAMSCRNNSTEKIESITAKLVQKTGFVANGHHSKKHSTIFSVKFDQKSFKGIAAVVEGQNRTESVQTENASILEELRSEAHVQSFPIKHLANLANSYSGGCITVSHRIEILIKTGECVDDPSLTIPLQVCEFTDKPIVAKPNVPPEDPQYPDSFASASNIYTEPTILVSTPMSSTGGAVHYGDDPAASNPTAPYSSHDAPSMGKLLREMKESVADLAIVHSYLDKDESKGIVESVSPMDFSKMVEQVDSDFDQPRVAKLVAERHLNFTCDHVIAALRTASEWNRSAIVEKLIPHCMDAKQNGSKVVAELTDWEKTVTDRVVKQYI